MVRFSQQPKPVSTGLDGVDLPALQQSLREQDHNRLVDPIERRKADTSMALRYAYLFDVVPMTGPRRTAVWDALRAHLASNEDIKSLAAQNGLDLASPEYKQLVASEAAEFTAALRMACGELAPQVEQTLALHAEHARVDQWWAPTAEALGVPLSATQKQQLAEAMRNSGYLKHRSNRIGSIVDPTRSSPQPAETDLAQVARRFLTPEQIAVIELDQRSVDDIGERIREQTPKS